jgi:hypothetical protein
MMSAKWPVQLLDVSLGGAAWSSPYALETGRVASIRTVFGGEAFHARLRVCWSQDADPARGGVRRVIAGAAFLSLEEDNRHVLHAFLDVST